MKIDATFDQELLAAAADAQGRLTGQFARLTAEEIEGSALDQAGLRDGLAIIEEYVRVGEAGVGFDHLLYMVTETGVPVSARTARFIAEQAPQRLPEVLIDEGSGHPST